MITGNNFEYLYDEYYTGLCVYAYRIVGSRESAEDIVQDVFCALWSNRKSVDFQLSAKAYLYLSVRNKSLDYLKRRNLQSRYEAIVQEKGEVSKNFTWEHLVEREITAFVNCALDKLEPDLREVFVLNKVEGRTASEIASTKGISVRTVEGQIARAIKKVKENLKGIQGILLLVWKFFSCKTKKNEKS